jgi:hypothetical protein
VIALLTTAVFAASSTSYCPASSGTVMADGARADAPSQARFRLPSVASNRHPLGTTLRLLDASVRGHKLVVVRDRIGHGSDLDIWSPSCAWSRWWGRRWLRYRVLHGAA